MAFLCGNQSCFYYREDIDLSHECITLDGLFPIHNTSTLQSNPVEPLQDQQQEQGASWLELTHADNIRHQATYHVSNLPVTVSNCHFDRGRYAHSL